VAVDMTLLAFTADCRAAVHMDPKTAAPVAIDQYCPPAGPTAANPPHFRPRIAYPTVETKRLV